MLNRDPPSLSNVRFVGLVHNNNTQPSIRTFRVVQKYNTRLGVYASCVCGLYRCRRRIGTLATYRVAVIEFVRHRGECDAR